jgi:hypothetical protein
MKNQENEFKINTKIGHWPIQAKLFASAVFFMISIGLFFAMIQVTIHDVLPTFQTLTNQSTVDSHDDAEMPTDEIGDLLSGSDVSEAKTPFYKTNDFLFVLKFTHIHIFGMGLLFMIIGCFVIFFDVNPKLRNALIILPFVGILIDLLAVWLKTFVSPYFFFLHIPGGSLFALVFVIDFGIAYKQMWKN